MFFELLVETHPCHYTNPALPLSRGEFYRLRLPLLVAFKYPYRTENPIAATKQTPPNIHHNKAKPPPTIIRLPTVGAKICAADHDILYNAAYSPRLFSVVRAIQKELVKGIAIISPRVMKTITAKPDNVPCGNTFNRTNPMPTNITPKLI